MKSGIVTIIGRPSSGKSTFLNTACGEKVSIVSAVPQTTRNAIRGIVNTNKGQIVFIDTPGLHSSEKKLNLKLQEIAKSRIEEADAVLYLLDLSRITLPNKSGVNRNTENASSQTTIDFFGEEEKIICELLQSFQKKLVIGLNKIDALVESSEHKKKPTSEKNLEKIFLLRQRLSEIFLELDPKNIFEVSALKDKGVDGILSNLIEKLPEGELLYPPEFYTDQDATFRMTEIIREQAILHTREEIPHSLYASIEDAEMRKNGKEMWVRAFLYVEKESQKAMLIGKGAAVIKSIRIKSMAQMRKIFPYKVQLDLQVRVNKNWRQKQNVINKLTQ